ncbi:type II CAAX endopeptidase family protein [Hydrogenophaga sp. PAMC20947]|uniref:CPBP family intramembrane glutamic endopeptidase n=1 Tax=Hydrogenophaga sp. PAMC20947 TaxID=2565558 RepID=UPI00109E2B6C|nr:type II CAAX endopeptidase family protein [Hydrogenophaga sp. PAMC20947]QCB45566.1 CPBP family intramembrane metalloprotease [Hydrogenophaga sp. PAMC20947]
MPSSTSSVVIGEPVAYHGETPSAASLIMFFALAFAWSWACWLLAPALQVDSPVAATTLALAGGFGPSLAAVVLVAYGAGMAGLRRWLLRCMRWRLRWHWFVLAFAFPVVIMGLAAAAHVVLGGTLPPSRAAGHVGMAAANFLLVFLAGGPVGEEFGWRGYALPALQARWGWRVASLLLGVVWAIWHLPLFYSPGTVQSLLPGGLFALSAIAASVLFAWLYNRSGGSVIPVLVLHTAVNAWSLIIPVMLLPDGSNLRPFQLVVGMLVLTAAALLCCGGKLFNKFVAPA